MKLMPTPPLPLLVLTDDRWSELSDVADRKGVQLTEIISEAIGLYLDKYKNSPEVDDTTTKAGKS